MRTKSALALATTLALGLIIGPAQADVKKVRVATDPVFDHYTYDDPLVTFHGHLVLSKPRAKCLRNRSVHLRQTDKGADAGSDRTDADGDWHITFNGNVISPGNFEATVKRKVIRKRRNGELVKKIICKAGESQFKVSS